MKKYSHIQTPLSHHQLPWKQILCASILFPSLSNAVTLSFGPLGGPSAPIPGTPGITYTTTTIAGGTATSGSHVSSGTVTSTIGSTYDGTFFDPLVDGDSSLTTVINGSPREDIDLGSADAYANYVGLCVEFSDPIEMFAFGFIDLDGREWTSSFAYDSTGAGTTYAPTVTLGSGSPELTSTTTAVSWGGLTGAPTTNPVVVANGGSHLPHDPESQIVFDYDGALITNLYFLFGINNDVTVEGGTQNSGVTGFTVVESNVPEPSQALLLLLGGAAMVLKRRR